MNNQQIFTKIKDHLLSQMVPAVGPDGDNGPGCMYLAPDGRKCAVGCLIKDEFYDRRMENESADSPRVQTALLASLDINYLELNTINLLNQAQHIHDSSEPEIWAEKLQKLAEQHALEY